MATGYTGAALEKNMGFRDFALRCTRAFGVCVDMRDEPSSVPPPQSIEADTHHKRQLKRAKEELAEFEAMNTAERIAYGRKHIDDAILSDLESRARMVKDNDYFKGLLAKVNAWEPPTTEHQGLNDFMVEQLTMSLWNIDRSDKNHEELVNSDPLDWFNDIFKMAKRSVTYHKEEAEKEISSANDGTKWLKDLRASLPKE